MRAAIAPAIQKETDAGSAVMAMTETTRPTRMASFQLSGATRKRGGGAAVAVVELIGGKIRRRGKK